MLQKIKNIPWNATSVQLLILGLIFLLFQIHKIFYIAPAPDNIWDNVYLWDWARKFAHGEYDTFVAGSQHLLRWGCWGFASTLIWIFSDEVLYYYLATIIPSTIGGLIFTYIAWRYIGFFSALLFSLLWYYDGGLFRATFQLLPTGAVLLPISLCLLVLTRVAEDKKLTTLRIILISIITFWIYGVKETYLAFLPGILLVLWHFGGVRAILIFGLIMTIGYLGETVFYRSLSDDFSWLGRVWMLLHDGHHLNLMLEDANQIAGQKRYFDSGITMRWARAPGVYSSIFFAGFLFALASFSGRFKLASIKNYTPHHVIAILAISFMVCTSFFIVSISPLRVGQPNMFRYIVIGLPLCYLMILWFCSQYFAGESIWIRVGVLAILPFLLAPAINRHLRYPTTSIITYSKSYNDLGMRIGDNDCVRGRKLSILRNELDLIPLDYRSDTLNDIIANYKNHFRPSRRYFAVKTPDSKCTQKFTLKRQTTTRN
jgi:hypothetical protein